MSSGKTGKLRFGAKVPAFERGVQTVATNCAKKLLDQYKSKGRKSAK